MSYEVIARKWRPQRFSDMVGQEHIARTLKNAIITGRIGHAYLFVGPRGIGKTTSARIFAKALNCTSPIDGEPCCQCTSCKSIANETNMDVIEIDAATHTQVEKARELCEDVLHRPISSKYKIYIIDEVHMLSKSAWNALLKTIEEPPAHAKFIFATTEVNKVLPTVISRCQRFDLRRIRTTDIAARLRLIADAEHIAISDSAIHVIAQAADGGMRDAQSLLDQLISFFGAGNAQISEEQALSLFGLTAPRDMELLIRAIVGNDRAAVITAIHGFAEKGKNLELLYDDVISWLRAIMLCRIVHDPADVLDESPEKLQLYSEIAKDVNPNAMQRLLEHLSSAGYMLREAINKQALIESILLKAMRVAHAPQIEDLIARLTQIRRSGELAPLDSVVPLYEMPAGQIVTRADSRFAPKLQEPAPVQPAPVPAPEPQPAPVPQPVVPAPPEPQPAPVPEPAVPELPAQEPVMEGPPMQEPLPEEIIVEDPAPEEIISEPPVPEKEEIVSPAPVMPTPQVPDAVPEEVASAATEEDPAGDGPDDGSREKADGPVELWEKLITEIRDNQKKTLLASFMEFGRPVDFRNGCLFVDFDSDYESMQCMMVSKDSSILSAHLRNLTGLPGAQLVLNTRPGLATPVEIEYHESVEELKKRVGQNPLVQQVVQYFDGYLADVREDEAHNGNL